MAKKDPDARPIADPEYIGRLARHGFGLTEEDIKEGSKAWRERNDEKKEEKTDEQA